MSPKKRARPGAPGALRPESASAAHDPLLEAGVTGGLTLLGAGGRTSNPGNLAAKRLRGGDEPRVTAEKEGMMKKVADAAVLTLAFLTGGRG